jgi:hypothetical protein
MRSWTFFGNVARGFEADLQDVLFLLRQDLITLEQLEAHVAAALPAITRTTHTLPLERLEPPDFERLCVVLLPREGFDSPQHYGATGSAGIRAGESGSPATSL